VVERGQVGQLDDARRGDHGIRGGLRPGLGGQQHEQRTEPLPAGLEEVAGGRGHEVGT